MVQAKICGLKTVEAVKTAAENGATYIGFVFFEKSPRNITPELAAELTKYKGTAKTVAVVVNATDDFLSHIHKTLKPDFFQLHGDESPARCAEIKQNFQTRIIKALKIKSGDDVAKANTFIDIADMLLFDARAPEAAVLPGGNGLKFDWNLLKNRNFSLPWLLSGGINALNMAEAVRITSAEIIDISSAVEIAPGEKSPQLIREFLKNAHEIKN